MSRVVHHDGDGAQSTQPPLEQSLGTDVAARVAREAAEGRSRQGQQPIISPSGSALQFASGGPVHLHDSPVPSFRREAHAAEGGATASGGRNAKGSDADGALAIDVEGSKSGRLDPDQEITVKFEDVHYKVVVNQPGGGGKWWSPSRLLPQRGGGGGGKEGEKKEAKEEKSKKEILHGINGSVLPGEVLAMMGPSGSGKTSFLNVLGGRVPQKLVTGTITYNDLPYSKALKRKMGFVTQDDTFFPHLTVRETLMYAALLRLPRELSRAQKIQRADETIDELGLTKCKNTIIGGQFLRGISGGERKRTSIGHEILIDPSLLLLDEPTSGLDSTTALKIVQLLIRLAQGGRTIITTIHQPSSRLFHSFDKLLLLAEGHSIYFGKARDAMPFYDSLGFRPQFAVNPADFLLDISNGTTQGISLPPDLEVAVKGKVGPDSATEVREYVVRLVRERQLPVVRQQLAELPTISDAARRIVLEKRSWNASWGEQFAVLWTRGLKERWHEYLSLLRFVQCIAISLICGCLWYNSKHNTQPKLQDQVGLMFFISIFWGFFPLFTAIFTFPQERAMLSKERASDMYQLSAYFLSRSLSDLPMEFVLPVIFLCIVYFMAGLRENGGTFFLTLLLIFLDVGVAQGLGLFIGAAVMDVKKATTMASVVLLTFMLAGGYYLQHIPDFIKWVKYISFNWYAYRLIMKIQYSRSELYNCGPGPAMCSVQESPSLRAVPLHNPWNDAWPLLLMLVGWRFLAYVALRRMKTGMA